jgi:hypothetical protein
MRFRSLFVACVLPLAATGAVYGCSGDPSPEDLCAWLQNPNGTNCVAEFHEDIGSKCGAVDPTTVTGTFSKREALDICVLAQGGSVVFDPPIELAKPPIPGMPTLMKIINADGSACGEVSHSDTFAWSLKIAAPPPSMGTSTASSSSSGGVGGAEEDGESHYSNGTISVTSLGGQTVTVACPAPDIHAVDVLPPPESHTFNLNQSLAATPQNGCPQYAQIIPQAILDIDPGGILRTGSVRLKIQFPPEVTKATSSGAGGAGAGGGSSTGSGAAVTIAPEVVYYFDCAIPGALEVCANGATDGNETDVDCGGPETKPGCPARCGEAQVCSGDCDCDNVSTCIPDKAGIKRCTAGDSGTVSKATCAGIICMNGKKDASESDVDCGGSCPAKCDDGQACGKNEDCTGNSCTLKVCGPPTCIDKSTNGDETDIDCGGATCDACDEGKTCKVGTDCLKGGCSAAGICSACNNGMKDPGESAVDCGGTTCAKCAEGLDCTTGTDCETGVCNGGKCNGCGDGVKNGKETDKDCGGPICSKDPKTQCDDGKECMAASDCKSNGCLNGKCSPCADGLQDNEETDIDCGGPNNCPKCDNGKVCVDAVDCISNQCDGNRCGSCSDGVKDGAESDIDCGGFVCGKCPEGKICNVDFDCGLGICEYPVDPTTSSSTGGGPMIGICNTCHNGFTDGTESDKDCGGATCAKCVKDDDCKVNTDCASGICIAKICK